MLFLLYFQFPQSSIGLVTGVQQVENSVPCEFPGKKKAFRFLLLEVSTLHLPEIVPYSAACPNAIDGKWERPRTSNGK